MNAKENFEKLYKTVEDIRTTFDEREHVKEKLTAVRTEAKQFFDDTVQKYQAEEEKLNHLIEQEKEKCTRLAAEFRTLSVEKTKCNMQEIAFQNEQRMKELREYLGTYDLTLQGLEATRHEIVITEKEQKIMNDYKAQGTKMLNQIKSMGETISMLLAKLKGEDAINCLGCFEWVPSMGNFMFEEMKEWDGLRKEENAE